MANPNHEPAGSPKGGQFAKKDGNTAMNDAIRKDAGVIQYNTKQDIKNQENAYSYYYGAKGSSKQLEQYLQTPAGQQQLDAARKHARSLSKDGKTVTLYRGINGAEDVYKDKPGKLSSWSFDGQTAYNFANGDFETNPKPTGVIFTAKVPIDKIFFTWKSFSPIGDDSVTGGMQEVIVREGNFKVSVDDTIDNS
jgi:hypothetical protein